MKPVRRLLRHSARGLQVTGATRDIIAEKILQLPKTAGLDRISGLSTILSSLAESRELKHIASVRFMPVLNSSDQGRMQRACYYINTYLSGPIGRAQIAHQAHLSEGACSRFFKLRTGKTLP